MLSLKMLQKLPKIILFVPVLVINAIQMGVRLVNINYLVHNLLKKIVINQLE